MIRIPEFMKAVFDAYLLDLKIQHGDKIAADAFWELLKCAAPDQIAKVREMRPDLWQELIDLNYDLKMEDKS